MSVIVINTLDSKVGLIPLSGISRVCSYPESAA